MNQKPINRRKLINQMGLLVGGSMLSASSVGVPVEEQVATTVGIIQVGSVKDARKLKDLQIGDIILTLGFYEPGDGGAACYKVVANTDNLDIDDGSFIPLNKNLVAQLIVRTAINYKMFGVISDSVNDDGIQIKLAHEYATKYNLPIENPTGEYWIKQTRNIIIKNSVDWGSSIFHIDERYNNKRPVFSVLSNDSAKDVVLPKDQKDLLLKVLKPGVQQIQFLKQYKNHLLVIRDQNDRIGVRYGARYNSSSWAKEELFYVEEDGRIIGDIAWQFNDFTFLKAYPAESSYLTLEGGSFYLSGNPPHNKKLGYIHNGFVITRSRTIIRNQWVGLENKSDDTALNPRSGFYTLSTIFDVTLENIRLIPWEQDREGKEKDVSAGTYGIGGSRWLNTTFRNISAEGTLLHWGVFGTNMNKNFKVENCRLNRIDVHFHCWNLSIKDSVIGNRGISITGGGDLIIENTICENRFFLNLRRDYGAKWDGNISIKNCKLRPVTANEPALFYSVPADFNYGYPIGMARHINIENFIFDFKSIPDYNENAWLFTTATFSKSNSKLRSFFPQQIICNNIRVEGRKEGLRLFKVVDNPGYKLHEEGNYDQVILKPNSLILFNNVQLDEIINEINDYHLEFKVDDDKDYDSYSLYPKVHFINCNAISLNLEKAITTLIFENCTINRINGSSESALKGEFTFFNCKFIPTIWPDDREPYELSSTLGTSLVNCVLHLPRLNEIADPESLSQIDFLNINKEVFYNQLNTRLGPDVLQYLNRHNIKLKKSFIEMLKNHHELE